MITMDAMQVLGEQLILRANFQLENVCQSFGFFQDV